MGPGPRNCTPTPAGAPGWAATTADGTLKIVAPAWGLVTAHGCVVSAGRSTTVAAADVHDESGTLCATALVTMRNLRAG